ncbi:MAG: AAA domain-containing protein, partial [Thermomicrobiales bacterium]
MRSAEVTQNEKVVKELEGGAEVVAGTAWLWAHGDLKDKIDVLFIDEAGQMSLANTLAVAQAAKSIVLLGDPQQLDQPLKGAHPEGTDASALGHLLGGAKTIASDRGLFLEETWRLSPKICAFTSELFYDGRLLSKSDCQNLQVVSKTPFSGTGLFYVPVTHEGNSNRSYEEVTA